MSLSDPKIIKEKGDKLFLTYLRNKKTMKDVIKEQFLLRNLFIFFCKSVKIILPEQLV